MKKDNVNRRDFLKIASLGSLALNFPFFLNSCRSAITNKKMNILFIAVDDLKPNLGCYGDSAAISPNIDRLAAEGTVFSNNHCQQAVCGPSRASLLTGLRPDKTQVWDLKTLIRDKNPDMLTMPQFFKNSGYQTAACGKIFDLRSVDKKHDEVSWTIPYEYPTVARWIGTKERLITQNIDLPDDEFIDGEIAGRGIQLMEQMNAADAPFFLAVGFKKPHLPFVAPKKNWDKFQRDQFKLAEFQEHAKNAPEFAFQPGWELRNGYDHVPKKGPIPKEMQQELIHGYYACVSHIDDQVGKLFAKLDELGIRDDTVIVLWGDHGWHLGDHGMWCKHTNFEQATRSPLIFSAPGIAGGRSSNSPTEFIDIFPTLCTLTGVETPPHLDGVSLVPVMKDPDFSVKDYAVSQFHRSKDKERLEGYALRTKRYRYIEWIKIEVRTDNKLYSKDKIVARELYDYEKDPLEKVSVINDPEYQSVVNKLSKLMNQYFVGGK